MEISTEMKRYILVAIAGIAIAAYVVPTAGLTSLNAFGTTGAGGRRILNVKGEMQTAEELLQ